MGMSASQSRELFLTARLADLELRAQQLSNAKIRLGSQQTNASNDYLNALNGTVASDSTSSYTDTSTQTVYASQSAKDNAVNTASVKYTAKMNSIESVEKVYDMELKNIETEHNAVQTEIDSVKKVIDKNVDRTFKIFS